MTLRSAPQIGLRHPCGPVALASLALRSVGSVATRDQTLPLAHGQAFAREIRDARLVVLDSMGHLPTPAQWDVVSALVASHVASATASPG